VNEDRRLSLPARAAIEAESVSGQISVSSITTWEIALLIKSGRLDFTATLEDWLSKVEALRNVVFLPVDNAMAIAAVNLPDPFHKDLADRLIVATARTRSCPVITAYEKIAPTPMSEPSGNPTSPQFHNRNPFPLRPQRDLPPD
jgi:PIN domain nuclease of toxin-antitoxin system